MNELRDVFAEELVERNDEDDEVDDEDDGDDELN